MNVSIYNCNNIEKGEIQIEAGKLNIKFAVNGSGKSTIVKAISSTVLSEDLGYLQPFDLIDEEGNVKVPKVNISEKIKKIAIFNDDYIDRYVFRKDELLENSFDVFVKTPKYDEHMEDISELLLEIRDVFQKDTELGNLLDNFEQFINSFGKALNGYSKSSEIGKSIGLGNKIANIPNNLTIYSAFLNDLDIGSKWVKWHKEGNIFLHLSENCPYCSIKLEERIELIQEIDSNFDNKYIDTLNKVLVNTNFLSRYFTSETNHILNDIKNNKEGITKEQIDYIKRLKIEVDDLYKKIKSLREIGFYTLYNVDKIKELLEDKQINLILYNHLNTNLMKLRINKINRSLKKVINKASILQGKINIQKKNILETIKKNKQEMNEFLSSAGFKYSVDIIQGEGKLYRLILKHVSSENQIENVTNHLSYGEKNVFALLMFKYQTIKEKSDFIILDDPVSSFDKHKKYSIMNMLFRGRCSFRNITTLMLTHDLEPVIDLIYTLKRIFEPLPTAFFIYNSNGKMSEKIINNEDIKSAISMFKYNVMNSKNIVSKLIYFRRMVECLNDKSEVWELLSNLFHMGRDIPKVLDSNNTLIDMDVTEVKLATKKIRKLIKRFKYDPVYKIIKDKKRMIELYKNTSCGYEKVQIYRIIFDGDLEQGSSLKKFIDETFHIQNDYLFQLNPLEFEYVPYYILDICDTKINDYENSLVS